MEFTKNSNNEDGFVLVVALMVMVILSLIGIAGLNTSMFEQQIAGNEWNAKRSFYKADGGATLGIELIEQSFNCPTGFQTARTQPILTTNIYINDMNLSNNTLMNDDEIKLKLDDPLNKYDVAYPSADGTLPTLDTGYLYFGGQTSVLPGGALQMAAGYEGKGKSAAQGGVAKLVDIYSQFLGPKNSEAIILSGWRHLVGTEGNCIY